jgi:hypothetical protein
MWIEGSSIMITRANTSPAHPIRWRLRMRTTLFVAGLFAVLALAVSVVVHPATARAYDGDYYAWCTSSLGQNAEVCCDNAGGELFSGGCVDPALLHPRVTPVPTITQQILPPPVIVPAPPH